MYVIMRQLFWKLYCQIPWRRCNLSKRNALLLNVGFLLHQGVGSSRDFDFELPAIRVGDDLDVSSLQGTIRFTRTAQGLLAQGRLEAQTQLECDRCLASFAQALEVDLDELFAYPPALATDPLLSIPETGLLDLNPLLREHFLLAIPLKPVCKPDCRGLCLECGIDLNESTCEHPVDDIDPRLAALRSLLPES